MTSVVDENYVRLIIIIIIIVKRRHCLAWRECVLSNNLKTPTPLNQPMQEGRGREISGNQKLTECNQVNNEASQLKIIVVV